MEFGDNVHSLDWPLWSLDTGARIETSTLHGMEQLLVLRNHRNCKILVPDGKVSAAVRNGVAVEVSNAAFKDETKPWENPPFLTYHEYNKHRRFGTLMATSRAGRLQLAALYTASEFHMRIPDALERRPGSSVALELLRQIDFVSPLAVSEHRSLEDVLRLGYFAPQLWDFADRTANRFIDLGNLFQAHDNVEPAAGEQATLSGLRPRNRAMARSAMQVIAPDVPSRKVRAPLTLHRVVNEALDLAD